MPLPIPQMSPQPNWSIGWGQPQTSEHVYVTADESRGADTDTSSDDGMEPLEITVNMNGTEHVVQ